MNFQASVGINIEKHRVSLVYLKRSLKGVSLAGQAIHGLEKPEGESRAAEVAERVNEFLNNHQIPSADIFIGIPRGLAILRYLELPLAVKENLKGTLTYEMEKYVPLAVSDIYFDFQILEEDKAAGNMTVLLIAVRKAVIDPYLQTGNRPGTGISGIEISSTALVNAFSRKPGAPESDVYAFVLNRDDHYELGVVEKNRLSYSRHVPKSQKGDDPRFLVSEELDLLRKKVGSEPDKLEIVISSTDDSVMEPVSQREDLDAGAVDLSGTGLSSDLLASAYGLALKGLHGMPMDINLLPVDLRKKVSQAPYYTLFALVGLLIIAILAWGASNVIQQQRTVAGLERELKQLRTEAAAVNRIRDRMNEVERRIEEVNVFRKQHVPALNLLRELSGEIPDTAWFNRFYMTEDKGDIEGYTDSASALIPLLASSPLLKDVAFLSPITKDGDGKEKFRIGFNLR